MAEQSTIKQISIGENEYEIDAKYWGGLETSMLDDLASKNYVNEKILVGTKTEYDVAYANNRIALGALVVILDDELGGNTGGDNAGTSATSKLGVAVLGQMKLGQE
jgi:hypothetical protein